MTAHDSRFTLGLVCDLFGVLEAHGYTRGDSQHVGRAFGQLLTLARTYEGTGDDPAAPAGNLAPRDKS